MIEDEKINQHEGSVMVGKVLKELYVDSALRNQNEIERKNSKKKVQKKPASVNTEKNISYRDFKLMQK